MTVIRRGMTRPLIVLALAVGANIVDLVVTGVALHAGIASEVNPVADALYRLAGVGGLALGKVFALLMLGGVLYTARAYRRDRAVALAVAALSVIAVAMPLVATAAGLVSLATVTGRL